MKKRIGIVTLAAGHSLMVGNACDTAQFRVNPDPESFGLLNVGSESFAATLQNTPTLASEDFINPIYRGLSETIVRKAFDPIDFSEPGVLKSSMHLMKGQTIYTNHFAYVGNEVGSVKDVFWEEAYTVGNLRIPAGFNLLMNIDAKSNPKLARGILMDPPSVHSNSVTVNFGWEQSHPKMDFRDFRANVGKLGPDGKLIRRIATNINTYYETSLVSHGADPFAQQQKKTGGIVNPNLAKARDSFSAEIEGATGFHFFSFKEQESFSATDTTPLSEDTTIPAGTNNNDNNENNTEMKFNKNIALALAVLIGYKFDEATSQLSEEEFETADLTAFTEALSNGLTTLQGLATLSTDNSALTQQVADLQAKVDAGTGAAELTAEQTGLIALGNKYKSEKLAEVIRLHALVNGEAPNEALTNNYNSANVEALEIFESNFKTQLEDKFPHSCQDCGSENIARNSASAAGGEGGQGKTQKPDLAKTQENLKMKFNR